MRHPLQQMLFVDVRAVAMQLPCHQMPESDVQGQLALSESWPLHGLSPHDCCQTCRLQDCCWPAELGRWAQGLQQWMSLDQGQPICAVQVCASRLATSLLPLASQGCTCTQLYDHAQNFMVQGEIAVSQGMGVMMLGQQACCVIQQQECSHTP